MAPARPKKTASRKPVKKASAGVKSPAKKQAAKTAVKKSATKRATTAKSSAAKKPTPRRNATSAADSVDEQLARYRSMRDFKITAEPSGAAKPSATSSPKGFPFVIQKHAASHLHYDFRLGWNGVLKSWAIAKGPSYYTGDRRLAVQVEDHPMEYGGFEGIIPKGQYGGGTVMVWDQGTWHPQPGYEDVTKALQEGSLKFVLDGTKLHGKWTLIRMAPRQNPPARAGAPRTSPTGSSSKNTTTSSAPSQRPRHHRHRTQLRRHRPHHGPDRQPERPRLELKRHRRHRPRLVPQRRRQLSTHLGELYHRREVQHPAPPPRKVHNQILRSQPPHRIPTRLHPSATRHRVRHSARRRLVASRNQARRLPHPGPQIRLPRPAPHPQRPRLDPPHARRRRRRRRASPPTNSPSTAKSSSSTTAASPPSPRCRHPSTKASATRSPTSSSTSSTSTATTPATSSSARAKNSSPPSSPTAMTAHSASAITSTAAAPPSSPRPASSRPKASSPSATHPTAPAAAPTG